MSLKGRGWEPQKGPRAGGRAQGMTLDLPVLNVACVGKTQSRSTGSDASGNVPQWFRTSGLDYIIGSDRQTAASIDT